MFMREGKSMFVRDGKGCLCVRNTRLYVRLDFSV